MSVLPKAQLTALQRAMLPLDGTIAEFVPDIVDAYAAIVPQREWSARSFIDLTAGSCLMPLAFAAHGVRRVVVNDTAARTTLAAAALFGRTPLSWAKVRALLARPVRKSITPSFHFACDFLTADVAEVFDRLYHGATEPGYRYLALRWVQGFALSPDEDFRALLTHDKKQLRDDLEYDWVPYLRRAANVTAVLKTLVRDINAGIEAVRARKVELYGEDMLTLCRRLKIDRDSFVAINPPTRGLDEYVIDDQLIHSLLANRWLPLSQCKESEAEFWRLRVGAALAVLPRGAHGLVWGGDGALRWSECLRFWTKFATPVTVRRVARGRYAAGWAIVRKN